MRLDSSPVLESWERDIARMVAQGLPDRTIARSLGISDSDVKERLVVIFRKLAMAGLLDQLIYAGTNAH